MTSIIFSPGRVSFPSLSDLLPPFQVISLITMDKTYNQRLFGTPLAKFLHESRFLWLKEMIQKKSTSKLRIMELGCLDARILNYLPKDSVEYYYGIDAGWDGYTDSAKEKYKNSNNINFLISTNPEDISTKEKADAAIAMQVFEYIPDDQYKKYFQKFLDAGCKDVFITVSNERGLFMFVKLLVKKLLGKNVASYSFKEIVYLISGKMDKIERKPGSMKGFDYKYLVSEIEDIYQIEKIVGLPFPKLPLALNFTIAIHAKHQE